MFYPPYGTAVLEGLRPCWLQRGGRPARYHVSLEAAATVVGAWRTVYSRNRWGQLPAPFPEHNALGVACARITQISTTPLLLPLFFGVEPVE